MILKHPQLHQGIGHAVTNEGIGNGVSHLIGIATSWRDAGNLGLKIQTTLTPRFVDTDLSDHPTAAIEHGYVANRSRRGMFALAFHPTLRAGVIFGRDDEMLDIILLSADQ